MGLKPLQMPAYCITVADAQNDIGLKQISGTCSSSIQFLARLNEAQKSLAIRGGWFDLQQRISFSIHGCHLVWPDFVGTVLGVRFCGGLAVMQNQWYSFAGNNDYHGGWGPGSAGYGLNGFGNGYGSTPYGNSNGYNGCVIVDDGMRCCYNEIPGNTGMKIRYVVVNPADYGKNITLFGKKFGAQPLQEKDDTGATVMGSTIRAAAPYGISNDLVTEITSITREETQGMAYLYGYDPVSGIVYDLARFMPYETNPRYRCSRISNMAQNVQGNVVGSNCVVNIEALCKLKFIELKHERDFLPISNLRATKLAFQAIRLEENNEDDEAVKKWAMAVHELQLEQNDLQPKFQVPVRMHMGRRLISPI